MKEVGMPKGGRSGALTFPIDAAPRSTARQYSRLSHGYDVVQLTHIDADLATFCLVVEPFMLKACRVTAQTTPDAAVLHRGPVLRVPPRRHGRRQATKGEGRAAAQMARCAPEEWPILRQKGRVRVGADADLTIFDSKTVIDRSTYMDATITSEGIEYVLVNAVPVIDAGELVQGVRPGRPVRAALEG